MVERLPGIHKALGSSPSTRRSGGGGGRGGELKTFKIYTFFPCQYSQNTTGQHLFFFFSDFHDFDLHEECF